MSLKQSYTLIAPLYDVFVAQATRGLRQNSLAQLANVDDKSILLAGVGTGLDFDYLPRAAHYTGLDLTPAMLKRAQEKAPADLAITLQQGDVTAMPFDDNTFDVVVCHLILAVVPEPEKMIKEVARVLKPGGEILVLDKFLQPGQRALGRRLLSFVVSRLATRLDVVFEEVIAHTPELHVVSDKPAVAGGWFRQIRLVKQSPPNP